jgi:hypothetical protein
VNQKRHGNRLSSETKGTTAGRDGGAFYRHRFSQWPSALTLACAILMVMEIFKWVKRRQEVAV